MNAIRDTMDLNNRIVTERMLQMERTQIAALEYTAAAQAPLSMNPPPTLPTKTGRKFQPPTRQKSITVAENTDANYDKGDNYDVEENSEDTAGESESWSMLDKAGSETKVKVSKFDSNVQTVGQRDSGDKDQL